MDTFESASRKAKQVGRQIESSVGNLKNMMSSISLVGDAKHFQEGRNKFDQLKTLLEGKHEKDKLEGMKTLIAMMTLGRDVSQFFPHVVKNVVVDSMEVKKLVYMYIIHYASQNPDLALLSISSFQKDMASPNPLVRAKALQAMATMRVSSVTHLIIIQLRNAVKDSSPYVRRTAAQVLPVVLNLDPKFKSDLIAMMAVLLGDDSVVVLSGALYAFEQICPANWDLIHPNFRKICHLLADMDEWGQTVALDLLLHYSRNQFASPFAKEEEKDEDKEENSEDEEESDHDDHFLGRTKSDGLDDNTRELDPDHRMVITCVSNLCYSMNTAVILGVVRLLYYIAPAEDCTESIRALIKHVHGEREMSYVLLANISTMATERAELFANFCTEFYIRATEPVYIKEQKLDILSKIANETNISNILKEFQAYARDPDVKFRCATIDAMGRCASTIPEVADQTMRSLMQMVQLGCPEVVASAVVVIRQIIQRDPSKYPKAMLSLLRLLNKTNVPAARSAIVWIIGEYRQYIAQYAPDALRILAKTFIREADEVKMQILNLAVKVYLSNPQHVSKLFKYILDLCKYDMNYDLRDRARLVRSVFFQKKKKGKKADEDESSVMNKDVSTEANRKLRTAMQEMFLAGKQVPEVISAYVDRDRFVMGTLSHVVIHSAGDNYNGIEDFPEIPPDNHAKRNPPNAESFGESSMQAEKGGFKWDAEDSKSVASFTSEDESGFEDESDYETGSDEESDVEDSSGDESDSSVASSHGSFTAKARSRTTRGEEETEEFSDDESESKEESSSEPGDSSEDDAEILVDPTKPKQSGKKESAKIKKARVRATRQEAAISSAGFSDDEDTSLASDDSSEESSSDDDDSSSDATEKPKKGKAKPTKTQKGSAATKKGKDSKAAAKKPNDNILDLFSGFSPDTLPGNAGTSAPLRSKASFDPLSDMFGSRGGSTAVTQRPPAQPTTPPAMQITSTPLDTFAVTPIPPTTLPSSPNIKSDTDEDSSDSEAEQLAKRRAMKTKKSKKSGKAVPKSRKKPPPKANKGSGKKGGKKATKSSRQTDSEESASDSGFSEDSSEELIAMSSDDGNSTSEDEEEEPVLETHKKKKKKSSSKASKIKEESKEDAAEVDLLDMAPPAKGIFDDVMNETMLTHSQIAEAQALGGGSADPSFFPTTAPIGGGSAAVASAGVASQIIPSTQLSNRARSSSSSRGTPGIGSTAAVSPDRDHVYNLNEFSVGATGELLNHTHTQGLQVDYEFLRSSSTYGNKFNLIKLRLENRWNTSLEKIAIGAVNIDQDEQDFRNIPSGVLPILQPGVRTAANIHIKFGKSSEMKFLISTTVGKWNTQLRAPPGEMMRPLAMDVKHFKQRQSRMRGMEERNVACSYKNLDDAANKVLTTFNLASLTSDDPSEIDMSEQRYFSGQLLHDDSVVLFELYTSKKNGTIKGKVHCEEFMIIDALADLARTVLN